MRRVVIALVLLLLGGLVGSAITRSLSGRTKEEPPFRKIMRFAFDQTVAERRAGNREFTDETFKKHALAISRFMLGDVPKGHKVVISIPQEPEKLPGEVERPPQQRHFRVIVFYDNGLTGGGHEFIFLRGTGDLEGIMNVHGE